MSIKLPTPDQVEGLDVKLAQFGGVDPRSATQLVTYVGLIASALGSTSVGRWASIPNNARLVSAAVFGVICVVHILGRYYHHSTVEAVNGQVKLKLIDAALKMGTPINVRSLPQAATASQPIGASSYSVGSAAPVADAGLQNPFIPPSAPQTAPQTAPAPTPAAPAPAPADAASAPVPAGWEQPLSSTL